MPYRDDSLVNHASLVMTQFEDGDVHFQIEKGQAIVQVNTVRAGTMEKKMMVVNAEKIQSNIQAEGRMAFYGIFFDFDKAELKPDSEAQLSEIALFLKTHPDTRVYVTGHSDNKGTLNYNLSLSDPLTGVPRRWLGPIAPFNLARPVEHRAWAKSKILVVAAAVSDVVPSFSKPEPERLAKRKFLPNHNAQCAAASIRCERTESVVTVSVRRAAGF